MKKIGNILFFGVTIFLVFIILCQAGVLPLRFIYIRSGSMQPSYAPGDIAFVYMGKNIQVSIGEVVLFSGPGGATLHRAINIENGQITTKGDSNNVADSNKLTQVDGKLLFAIPKIGYVVDFIQIPFRVLVQLIKGSRS
jgi:signal peptidase I